MAIVCEGCGWRQDFSQVVRPCPECGAKTRRVKSGKERKVKRRARKQADELVEKVVGDHWLSNSPYQARRDADLIARAIKERWLTGVSGEALEQLARNLPKLSSRDVAVVILRRLILHPDSKTAIRAIRALIEMEGQNMRDQHHATKPAVPTHLHLHLSKEVAEWDDERLIQERAKLLEVDDAGSS